jgi:diguanylate cyclase (GGDEF)-like protein
MDWTRKDHATLKVHVSGQEVTGGQDELNAYEIIAEDVTKQRELEGRLRRPHMEIKRSVRTSREFAVLLFDLDGLKVINDRYGHMTGSQALRRMADVLSLCCRDIDTASRFGGDEFALVLPEHEHGRGQSCGATHLRERCP